MLSKRAKNIKDSITMAISAEAKRLKNEGKDILSFSAGEPDFDTPDVIKQAAIDALNSGKTKYTAASGIPELKDAVCAKFNADQGLDYAPNNIVVSCGAKHSIFNALMAVIEEGDEVIIPSPYWVSYPDQVELMGGVPVIIEGQESNNFRITPEQLEAAITPKTKLLILNSPSNPTGSVYNKDELTALAAIIEKSGILVLSDEIYEKLVYDGQHVSIVECNPNIKDLAIIINGVSKAYSMTGWRIGYLAAKAEIASAIGKIQSQSTSNPTSIAQWASVAALEKGDEAIQEMKAAFVERRNVMVDGLNKIDGITCLKPEGAFYTFPNISAHYGKQGKYGPINNSLDFCEQLLKDQLVACVPGVGFGAPNNIRFSYATSLDDITKGLERLNTFVSQLTAVPTTA